MIRREKKPRIKKKINQSSLKKSQGLNLRMATLEGGERKGTGTQG